MDYELIEKTILSRIKDVRTVLQHKHGLQIPFKCDPFIARCLRLKDGKVDGAIKLILTIRATVAQVKDWNVKLLPSLYEEILTNGTARLLMKRDSLDRRILVLTPHIWNPDVLSFDELITALWILLQFMNKEYIDVQRHGFIVIFDFTSFSLKHAWAIKQWRLLSLAKWAQNGVAGRVKAVHCVFHPRVIGVIYAGIKPFLKEKLKRRIFFHGSLESMHHHVDIRSLPTCLGGHMELLDDDCVNKNFIKNLLRQDDYFKDYLENTFPSK